MYEVKITLDVSPRFEDALLRLADGLAGVHAAPPASAPEHAPSEEPVFQPPAPENPVNPQQGTGTPANGNSAAIITFPSANAQTPPENAPTAPAPITSPAAVPVSTAPAYTVGQVCQAGANLVSANPAKMQELQALLAQYGVNAVVALKPDQLGSFATALRGLGAQI